MGKRIYKICEIVRSYEHDDENAYPVFNYNEYIIDVDALEKFKIEEDFCYNYISVIIENIEMYGTHQFSSLKYSFSDAPDWYAPILLERVEAEDTVLVDIHYDVE